MKSFRLCSSKPRVSFFVWLFFSAFSLFAELDPKLAESNVEALLVEGKALAEKGKFSNALSVLNRALSLATDKSSNPSDSALRAKVEQAIRITKGRAIVARYKDKKPRDEVVENSFLKTNEPSDLEVMQFFGSVMLRGTWIPRTLSKEGEAFGFGRRITVSSRSGIELKVLGKDEVKLRAVDASSFSFSANDSLSVFSGAYALRVDDDDCRIQLTAPFAELEIFSKDPFAVMFGVTTNGGLKLIGLVGKVELRRPREKTVELRPGQLVFALPKGFSRKMYVELSTLMATADLLTAFKEPPDYYKRLKTEALAQALRTRKRFRTLVGDVKNTESFELKVLDEDRK